MPHLKLSQAAVDRLRLPPAGGKAVTHWDQALIGFGVRVSPQGRKTFLAQYRARGLGAGGKDLEIVETFGTADKITLAEAQRQARTSFALAREGVHPVQARKQKLASAQASAAEIAFTFEKLAERYLAEYVDRNYRASTAKEARRYLMRAARLIGERPASLITRDDIDALIAAILAATSPRAAAAKTGGLVEANNLLATLQRLFKWGRQMRLIPLDPSLEIPKPLQKVPSRDRVLEDAEIIGFWHGCDAIGWPFGRLFQLLLLTGQRLSECSGMCWSEIDLDKRTWILPKERTKNGKAHEIALSTLAVEILEALPRFAGSDLVFPSERNNQPVVGFNYPKLNVMKHMEGPEWRLHDLRRTCTTGMARLGVPPHVADRVLNHQSGTISGVAAVYNRFQYLDERREALNAWGGFIERLIGRGGDNVVALAGR